MLVILAGLLLQGALAGRTTPEEPEPVPVL